jgi:hypothetical protein
MSVNVNFDFGDISRLDQSELSKANVTPSQNFQQRFFLITSLLSLFCLKGLLIKYIHNIMGNGASLLVQNELSKPIDTSDLKDEAEARAEVTQPHHLGQLFLKK